MYASLILKVSMLVHLGGIIIGVPCRVAEKEPSVLQDEG